MDTFNERATTIVTVNFRDDNGTAVQPDTATYRVDDVRSGENLVPATSIGSLAASVEIVIASADMRVLDRRREFEQHRLTATFTYGGGRVGNDAYLFLVRNLPKVDSPDVSASASTSPSSSRSPSASISPSVSASASASPSA